MNICNSVVSNLMRSLAIQSVILIFDRLPVAGRDGDGAHMVQ